MAFGISAAAWAAIAVGTTAVATAYSADSQRKGRAPQRFARLESGARDKHEPDREGTDREQEPEPLEAEQRDVER